MTTVEFGVEWQYLGGGGRFIAGGYTELGARDVVQRASKGYDPRPVRAMRRESGEWVPVGDRFQRTRSKE